MSFGRDGRHGRGRAGRLVVLLAVAVLLAVSGPASPAPAAALSCQVRVSRSGKRVCWCWDGRWVTAPMVLCRLAG